ncbi:hypothetical protein O6H91_01G091300 [Diphasiastrum complanatum]|nr:hypothetical protein O6H91_01G091300 [Diphasiastrum complanatum]
MQALVRVQALVRARRVRMSEEGLAVQRHIWQRRQQIQPSDPLLDGNYQDGWNDSVKSLQEIKAKVHNRHEAALKRERALAYALSHQLIRSSNDASPMFIDCDPDKPHWGWSWLERWMAARCWESRIISDKEATDAASIKSMEHMNVKAVQGEQMRRLPSIKRQLSTHQPGYSPSHFHSHPSPHSHQKAENGGMQQVPIIQPPVAKLTPVQAIRSSSPRSRAIEEEASTVYTARSAASGRSTPTLPYGFARFSRSSVTSSIRDDDSLLSFSSMPSYMAITQSARAKMRSLSTPKERPGTPEKEFIVSARKRLSFPIAESPQSARPARPIFAHRSPSLKGFPGSAITADI